MQHRRKGLIALMLLLVGACASSQEEPRTAGPETTIQVENQSFNDMTIYVYERSQRVRLGTAPGLSTRTFTIPDRMLFGISALRFEADPVGSSQTTFSDEIGVSQGQSLRLVIPPR